MAGWTWEKWTLEVATEYINRVLKYVEETDDCFTLGEAAVKCGEYEEVVFYLEDKFPNEFNSIKKAREIIKARCLKQGMLFKTQPTMTIFNLVNNFGMVNTNQKNNNTNENKTTLDVNLNGLTNKELDDAAEKIAKAIGNSESENATESDT